MRYLCGFVCVCALGLVPLVGCSEGGGDGDSANVEVITGGAELLPEILHGISVSSEPGGGEPRGGFHHDAWARSSLWSVRKTGVQKRIRSAHLRELGWLGPDFTYSRGYR